MQRCFRRFHGTLPSAGASLKDTLRLPTTTFPIVPSDSKTERASLLKKITSDLYIQQSQRDDAPTFILHDGPPYANGALHIGHALNKILKDVINRVQVLEGKKVVFQPGWDCHGLPIELKALQAKQEKAGTKLDKSAAKAAKGAVEMGKSMSPLEIRGIARELASGTIEQQMSNFKDWGIMADWEGKYVTMDKDYEMRQLEVFRDMLKKGLIYRKNRPVYWSPSSGSALAEAELEYDPAYKSQSAFVKFPLQQEIGGQKDVSAVIWTTTPWTIPANKAIAVGEEIEYCIVQSAKHGKLLIASEAIADLQKKLEEEFTVIAGPMPGTELVGSNYTHPLLSEAAPQPILSADFVTAESGTGLVHLAPGHGMDDYLVCLKHEIPPFSPVDNNGCYTADTLPSLVGKEVLYGGQKAVVALMEESNCLIFQHKFEHKYPLDWRTKSPVIVRATAQWFANAGGIKEAAHTALENVTFLPKTGATRLNSFVQNRSEWCISRQRAWGVPIPALYDAESGEPLLTEESVNHIITVLNEKGTDSWFDPSVPNEVFVSPEFANDGKQYIRGKETMDVWFDSGTSWATLASRLGQPDVTADIYLEGSDQHRGWFQSSLITSLATREQAPFKQVITHGFILDGKGKKMSKSLGNVVSPSDLTLKAPTDINLPKPQKPLAKMQRIDILRLWVAFCDFTRDISVGPKVVSQVHEILRKARVTTRFCLGVLEDWDGIYTPYSELGKLDKIALAHLAQVNNKVRESYAQYNFNKAVSALAQYTTNDLSAFYLDVIKDRLYTLSPEDPSRRSAQTTIAYVLRNYLSLLSPLIPLLVQEVWSHAPKSLLRSTPQEERQMLEYFSAAEGWEMNWAGEKLITDFENLKTLHDAVKQGIERAKTAGNAKVNLEAGVEIVVPKGGYAEKFVKSYLEELEQLAIVSDVSVMVEGEGCLAAQEEVAWCEKVEAEIAGTKVQVNVRKAGGEKCKRCWKYKAPTVGTVCGRCMQVLKGIGYSGEI
jgi:isoleucyl-tRNA synthetase